MFDLNLVPAEGDEPDAAPNLHCPVPFQGGEEGPDQIPAHVQVEEDGGALEEEALFDLHMNPGKLQSFLYPSLDCMLMYFTLPLNLQENNDALNLQEEENVADEQDQIHTVQVDNTFFDLNMDPGKIPDPYVYLLFFNGVHNTFTPQKMLHLRNNRTMLQTIQVRLAQLKNN
jgi:hypothetical protein